MLRPIGPDTQVIESARFDASPTFFIGPYGARVSFGSQQKRALNLVAALHRQPGSPLVPAAQVAVVGGGVAGVTAAIALMRLGCAVSMFETEAEALMFQDRTTHRYVHPSVNFWPLSVPVEPTTNLPFLDWYASTPHEVLRELRLQWAPYAERLREPPLGRRIVSRSPTSGDKVELRDDRGEPWTFDAVFMACGFGPEINLEDEAQLTYWDPDELETKLARRTGREFTVSGTGDGGVIDALRLVHLKFDQGALVEDLIAEIEEFCPDLRVEAGVIELDAARQTDPDPVEQRRKRAAFLASEYPALLRRLHGRAARLLNESYAQVDPEDRNKVWLVGQLPAPYELSAAPIHRLMLAHALLTHRIDFVEADLSYDGGAFYLTPPAGVRRPVTGERPIVRHGTERQPTLTSAAEDVMLRRIQGTFGALISEDMYGATFDPKDDVEQSKRLEMRQEIAHRALRRQFGYGVEFRGATPGYVAYPLREIPELVQLREPQRLPRRIYGEVLDKREADSLVAPNEYLRGPGR